MESPQYIYLLQEREFIKTKENIYKIGKTTQPNHERLKQYPKGSSLLLQSVCSDCNIIEKELINEFKHKFKQRLDIGIEYFEGNYIDMIRVINTGIDNHNNHRCLSLLQLKEENDKLKHRIKYLEREVQSQSISKFKYMEMKKENDILNEKVIKLKQEKDKQYEMMSTTCDTLGDENDSLKKDNEALNDRINDYKLIIDDYYKLISQELTYSNDYEYVHIYKYDLQKLKNENIQTYIRIKLGESYPLPEKINYKVDNTSSYIKNKEMLYMDLDFASPIDIHKNKQIIDLFKNDYKQYNVAIHIGEEVRYSNNGDGCMLVLIIDKIKYPEIDIWNFDKYYLNEHDYPFISYLYMDHNLMVYKDIMAYDFNDSTVKIIQSILEFINKK